MRALLIVFALLFSTPVIARDFDGFVQITAGQPVRLKPDRAYILFRTLKLKGIKVSDTIFLRETDLNLPNLTRVRASQPFAETATENFYLIEALPGLYLIAGQADKQSPQVETCFCMGSVRFDAKAGQITDLGYVFNDHAASRSPIPELQAASGRGARINGMGRVMVGAVRPMAADTALPLALSSWPRTAADFRAVGKFTNGFAVQISRLEPLAGVLAYDEDRVIDLKASDER